MRTLSKILVASAGALALAAAAVPANAAQISIWISANGGPLTQVGFDPLSTGTATFSGTFGGFQVNHLSGSAGVSPVSDTQALDTVCDNFVCGAGGDLDVFVSAQFLTSPTGNINWLSTFQTQPLGAGWTLTENTWLSQTNDPQTGIPLGNATMGPDPLPQQFHNFQIANTGGGAYAINTEYQVHAGGIGSANSTIDVFDAGAVPEPTTWGLMIVGFGGIGAMVRGRRRQAVALTA